MPCLPGGPGGPRGDRVEFEGLHGVGETYQRVLEYRVSRDFERLERDANDQVRPEPVLLHFLLGQLIWSLH